MSFYLIRSTNSLKSARFSIWFNCSFGNGISRVVLVAKATKNQNSNMKINTNVTSCWVVDEPERIKSKQKRINFLAQEPQRERLSINMRQDSMRVLKSPPASYTVQLPRAAVDTVVNDVVVFFLLDSRLHRPFIYVLTAECNRPMGFGTLWPLNWTKKRPTDEK